MVDFVSMDTYDLKCAKSLLKQNKYNFEQHICLESGEILRYAARFGPLLIKIFPNGRISFSGSLHKFYNFISSGKSHNFNSFDFKNFEYVINYFQQTFGVNVDKVTIHNLEIGFNLNTELPVNVILENIKFYRTHPFFAKAFDTPGTMLVCPLSEHRIKIYDKGLQQNSGLNVIRIEDHINKIRSKFSNGVILSDFLDKEMWIICSELLIKSVNSITFNDYFIQSELGSRSKKILNEINDISLFKNMERRTRSRKLKTFNLLIENKGSLKIRDSLVRSINKEMRFLLRA